MLIISFSDYIVTSQISLKKRLSKQWLVVEKLGWRIEQILEARINVLFMTEIEREGITIN